MELYNVLKALHLIFMVTWFAGLFYVPRLFIYHIEAQQKPLPVREVVTEQLKVMTKRLWYIITWPSAVLCTLFAIGLLLLRPAWLQQPWMQIKLGFVGLLFLYHLKCHSMFKQLQGDVVRYTARFMRIWNEGATLILFAVVFLVVLRNAFNWVYGIAGLLGVAVLLLLGIRLYRRIRNKNPEA